MIITALLILSMLVSSCGVRDAAKGGITSSGAEGRGPEKKNSEEPSDQAADVNDSSYIGISWNSQIFIQEYWENNTPFYSIYNNRDEGINLKITISKMDLESGEITDKELEQSLAVPSKSLEGFNMKFLVDEADCESCYLKFHLKDGTFIGSMYLPTPPSDQSSEVVTNTSLNVGSKNSGSFWFEQDQLEYQPSSNISITLKTLPNSGFIEFSKKTFADRAKEAGLKNSDTPLTEMIVLSASSDDVNIIETSEKFVIDTQNSSDSVLSISLEFQAPVTSNPKEMVFFSGLVCDAHQDDAREQCVWEVPFSRGIVISDE